VISELDLNVSIDTSEQHHVKNMSEYDAVILMSCTEEQKTLADAQTALPGQ
jgi:hypothetical protein